MVLPSSQDQRKSALSRAIGIFASEDVKKVRPDGLSSEDCIRLLLSNGVCSSPRLAKDYVQTLLYDGRLEMQGGKYVLKRVSAKAAKGEADEILSKVLNAKTSK